MQLDLCCTMLLTALVVVVASMMPAGVGPSRLSTNLSAACCDTKTALSAYVGSLLLHPGDCGRNFGAVMRRHHVLICCDVHDAGDDVLMLIEWCSDDFLMLIKWCFDVILMIS